VGFWSFVEACNEHNPKHSKHCSESSLLLGSGKNAFFGSGAQFFGLNRDKKIVPNTNSTCGNFCQCSALMCALQLNPDVTFVVAKSIAGCNW
jgi:hypothetical protein